MFVLADNRKELKLGCFDLVIIYELGCFRDIIRCSTGSGVEVNEKIKIKLDLNLRGENFFCV